MRKFLAVCLLAMSCSALADIVLKNEGSTVGPINKIDCVGGIINCTRTGGAAVLTVDAGTETTGALALFVELDGGSDATACTGHGVNACLTIQGAFNRIPKGARHPVTITIGSGSFAAGAYVDGFSIVNDLNSPATGAYLQVDGTLANFAVATGSATGTATGGIAGTVPTSFGTLIDSAQTWTVNNLRGRLVEKTTSGTVEIQVIQSNDATTVTIVGNWTAPSAGVSTYRILDWATNITGALNQPASNSFTAASSGIGNTASFFVGSNSTSSEGITFRWLRFSSNTTPIRINGSSTTRIVESRFEQTSAFMLGVIGSALVALSRNSFVVGGQSPGIFQGSAGTPVRITSSEDLFRGNGSTFGTISSLSTGDSYSFTNSAIENVAAGIRVQAGNVQVTGTRFETISGDAIGSNANGTILTNVGNGQINISSAAFNSCGVAMNISGQNALTTNLVQGTGNTIAYNIENGGVVREHASSTITAGTEIMLDGTAYAVAALRAVVGPPAKSLSNPSTFSRIFEL